MDDSEDSYEPIRPKPSDPPPLKRLWQAPPESDSAADVPVSHAKKIRAEADERSTLPDEPPRPRKKKKKPVEEVVDDGTGVTKLEETPVLDTYETRQRIRWVIGGVLSVIGLLLLFVVLRAFKGSGTPEVVEAPPPEPRITVDSRPPIEQEARVLLDMAKQTDKNGNRVAAVGMLEKLVRNYQATPAGREALVAIDRNKKGRSLFGLDTPDQAPGPVTPTDRPGEAVAPKTGQAQGTVAATPPRPQAPPYTRPLPPGYRPKFDHPIHPSGWPTRISCDVDGAVLALVPAATLLMGREDGDPAERPAHQVAVSTYYIDLHEVTLGQYLAFLKETGRPIELARIAPWESARGPQADEMPVVNLSAREAKAYCNWAKRRLPTEAQWELAARGPEGRISYWNGELPRKDESRGNRAIEPVMTLPTDLSSFGAHDLAANAWEWTSEYFDSKYYQQFRNLVTDPTGPKEPPAKLALVTVKGGSKGGILTWREGLKIESRFPYLGFRGALPVEGAPIAPPPAPTTAPGPGSAPAGEVVPF